MIKYEVHMWDKQTPLINIGHDRPNCEIPLFIGNMVRTDLELAATYAECNIPDGDSERKVLHTYSELVPMTFGYLVKKGVLSPDELEFWHNNECICRMDNDGDFIDLGMVDETGFHLYFDTDKNPLKTKN